MKWFKKVTVLTAIMALALPAAANAFYPMEASEEDRALDLSIILYSWWEGVWYQASFMGIPFTGIMTLGDPLVIEIPDTIYVEIDLIDIDYEQFTFDYFVTGMFELEGVATYAHGIYGLFYNPLAPTPGIWTFDLNGFIFNYTDMLQLWVLSNVPGSTGFEHLIAVPGSTDLSFEFPGFLSVEANVTEFGETTNTISNIIDGHVGYFVGYVWLPFGFYSFAYGFPPWMP